MRISNLVLEDIDNFKFKDVMFEYSLETMTEF